MPEIPTFVSTQSYQGAGGGQPQTISPEYALTSRNPFADAAKVFADLTENMAKQQAAVEASKKAGELDMQLVDLQARFAQDPDPATAPQRFREEMPRVLESTLTQTNNPLVRDMITKHFASKQAPAYSAVLQHSIKSQNSLLIGETERVGSTESLNFTSAPDALGRASAMDRLNSQYDIAVSTGAMTPEQARMNKSANLGAAIRGMKNPIEAKKLADGLVKAGVLDVAHYTQIQDSINDGVQNVTASRWVLGKMSESTQPSGRATGISIPPKGFDNEWARIVGIESNGRQFDDSGNVLTSKAGALGKSQILIPTAEDVAKSLGETLDVDRLKNDKAYNERLGKEYYRQMREKYGDPTLAAAAYNGGPGRVDEWLQKYGDPRNGDISMSDWVEKIPIEETRDYAKKFGFASTSSNNEKLTPEKEAEWKEKYMRLTGKNPDEEGVTKEQGMARIQEAEYRPPGFVSEAQFARMRQQNDDENMLTNPTLHAKIETRINREYTKQNALLHDIRSKEATNFEMNVLPAFMQGKGDHLDFDGLKARYANIFPPEQAKIMNDKLDIAKAGGSYIAAIDQASPAQLSEIVARTRADPTHPDYKFQLAVQQNVDQAIHSHQEQKNKNPAGYAARSETVQQYAAATKDRPQAPQEDSSLLSQSNNQRPWADYIRALLAQQDAVGIAKSKQDPLPNEIIHNLVADVASTDITKESLVEKFKGYEQQFGEFWPRVHEQMVKVGKLPEGMSILGNLTGREQAATAVALEAALKMGGVGIKKILPDQSWKDTEKAVTANLQPFFRVAGMKNSSNSISLMKEYQSAATTLAAYYVMKDGNPPGQAAKRAVDGLLNDMWSFSGNLMYPKEDEGRSIALARRIQKNLKVEDLHVPGISDKEGPATRALSDDQRKEVYRAVVENGVWVMNNNATGYELRAQADNGALIPVKYKSGGIVSVRHADVKNGTYGGRAVVGSEGLDRAAAIEMAGQDILSLKSMGASP